MLLPTLPSGQQLLAQQGKQGTIYLLDINNLGKYCINQSPPCTNTDTQIVQEIMDASSGIWGSPAYWNGNLYWTGVNDRIQAYSFNANNSGLISTTPTSSSAQFSPSQRPRRPSPPTATSTAFSGHWTAVRMTRRAAAAGPIAWGSTPTMRPILQTCSTTASKQRTRDSPGAAVKFEKPIIANGKVYVGTHSSVSVYGLLAGIPLTASPT